MVLMASVAFGQTSPVLEDKGYGYENYGDSSFLRLAFTQSSALPIQMVCYVQNKTTGSVETYIDTFYTYQVSYYIPNLKQGIVYDLTMQFANSLGGSGQYNYEITANYVAGIAEIATQPQLIVTKGQIALTNVDQFIQSPVIISDMLGRTVYQTTITSSNQTISLPALQKSIYIFSAKAGSQSLTRKFVVN